MTSINRDREAELLHTRLVEVLDYDMYTGIFTNKINGIRRIKHAACGSITAYGYINITIDRKVFRAHRLAWFYCFEEWPEGILDHIDSNKSNNALDNLREATETLNKGNSPKQRNNTSGFKGVSFDKESGKFKASIRINRILKNLGRYTTAEEASQAYLLASRLHFGEFSI